MDRAFWDQMASLENRVEAMFRGMGLWTPGRTKLGVLPGRPFAPAMDVIARNGDMVIRIDLPGIDPAKDLTVTVEEDELTIRGERTELSKIEEKDFYRTETFQGTFERHVPLPEGTPQDRITAEYTNGVLEIVVPRRTKPPAEAKPKKITVKTPATTKT